MRKMVEFCGETAYAEIRGGVVGYWAEPDDLGEPGEYRCFYCCEELSGWDDICKNCDDTSEDGNF